MLGAEVASDPEVVSAPGGDQEDLLEDIVGQGQIAAGKAGDLAADGLGMAQEHQADLSSDGIGSHGSVSLRRRLDLAGKPNHGGPGCHRLGAALSRRRQK